MLPHCIPRGSSYFFQNVRFCLSAVRGKRGKVVGVGGGVSMDRGIFYLPPKYRLRGEGPFSFWGFSMFEGELFKKAEAGVVAGLVR